jgi:hypothetical protein
MASRHRRLGKGRIPARQGWAGEKRDQNDKGHASTANRSDTADPHP